MAANSLERELADFHADHPVQEVTAGYAWRYYRGGPAGAETVLFLSGALGRAEYAFQVIRNLERRFRVIAPDYPAVRTLGEFGDGLLGILDAEHVRRAHLLGGSFGGFVAQALVRRAPERVASLVLSHTGAADGRKRDGAIALVSMLPGWLMRAAMRARLGPTLKGADPFWRALFDRTVADLSREDILSRMKIQAEFAANPEIARTPANWAGPVLILEAADDPLFTEKARRKMRAIYPRAAVHEFRGTGHAAALLRPDEYVDVVAAFIASAAG